MVPVLELLDMHGVKRGDIYLEIATKLKEKLLPRIESLSQARLQALLEVCAGMVFVV